MLYRHESNQYAYFVGVRYEINIDNLLCYINCDNVNIYKHLKALKFKYTCPCPCRYLHVQCVYLIRANLKYVPL